MTKPDKNPLQDETETPMNLKALKLKKGLRKGSDVMKQKFLTC